MGLLAATPLRAANLTTSTTQTGPDWTVAIWQTNGAGTAVSPVAGNTYEVLNNGLIRSPQASSSAGLPIVFPGDSLQFDPGGGVRLKSNGGAPGFFTFSGNGSALILNGGFLGNGDDFSATIVSPVNVVADSGIYAGVDATTANATSGAQQGFRNYVFTGSLSGTNNLTLGNAVLWNNPQVTASVGTTPNFVFNGDGSGYSGNITNTAGWLQAGSANAFGSADITIAGGAGANGVNGPAQFDATVAFSDPGTLTIANTNSFLLLDNSMTFGAAIIDGNTFTNGVYTSAQINAITGKTNVVDGTGANTLTVGSFSIVNLTWVGNVNTNWNTVTANWTSNAIAANYTDGNFALFNDTASKSNVNVAANLSPGGVTVSNSTLAYVFNGNGGIDGIGGLTKLGTSTLTLGGTNSYSGATTITAGRLLVSGKKNGAG